MATQRFFPFLSTACVLMLTLCPSLLRAQAAEGKSTVEFCCVAWDTLPIDTVLYRDGERYLPLVFATGTRSALYPLKIATSLELYEKEVNADDVTTYRLLGKAPLIKGARRMLFLVDAVTNASGVQLRLFGVNDALDVFPPGTSRFFNFSKAELQVKFGGQVSKLPAGKISVVKSNVSKKGGFIPFLIGDLKGKVVFETRLFSQPSGRDMVFIGAPARPGGRVLVKVIPQLISAKPAEPTNQ